MSKTPARKPLAHAPSNQKNDGLAFGQNRPQTTMDRVLSKLNNIKNK